MSEVNQEATSEKKSEMNLEDVLNFSKEVLLQEGSIEPTLFFEAQIKTESELNGFVLPIFADIWNGGSTLQKRIMLFQVGRNFAQQIPVVTESIKNIFLATEAWLTVRDKNDPHAFDRPGDQPDRKEVLIVSQMDLKQNLKQSAVIYEMIRNEKTEEVSESIDLIRMQEMDEIESELLPAVLAGIASTMYTDKELAEQLGEDFDGN